MNLWTKSVSLSMFKNTDNCIRDASVRSNFVLFLPFFLPKYVLFCPLFCPKMSFFPLKTAPKVAGRPELRPLHSFMIVWFSQLHHFIQIHLSSLLSLLVTCQSYLVDAFLDCRSISSQYIAVYCHQPVSLNNLNRQPTASFFLVVYYFPISYVLSGVGFPQHTDIFEEDLHQ